MTRCIRVLLSCLVVSIPAGSAHADLDDGLLLWLDFDTTIGKELQDLSSNGLHAWPSPSPVFVEVSGGPERAMMFHGSADQVDLPVGAIDAVANLTEGSVFVQFSFDDVLATENILPILYFGNDDPAEPDNFLVIEVGHSDAADRKLYVTWVVDDIVQLSFDTDVELKPGVLHAFVAVAGPAGNTAFLNGYALPTRHYTVGSQATRVFFADIPADALDTFSVGWGKTTDDHTPDFVYHHGMVDELRLYDRALTATEGKNLTSPP